jgi:LEA14-like dessication related protein
MLKSIHNNAFLFFLTVLSALGLMTSCKTVNINADAPEKVAPTAPNIAIVPSVINVPVSFSVTQIESRINQELNGVIYKDDNIEDDNYMMTITKNGMIKVTADNNKISFAVPLHISVTGRWQWEPCSICPKISKTQSSEFDIVVTSQSAISLTENWQIKTQTTGDYSWGNQRPNLEIGPIKIPISSVVDFALKPQMAKLSARFDQEIQNRVNIKDYVKKAWIMAQQPILVDKTYNTWLLMTPSEVSATGLQAKNGKLNMTIGIKTLIETISGDMPHPIVNNNLPKLSPHNGQNDDFNIGLSGEITYAFASDILKKEIAGQTYNFSDNKYEIKVDSISLTGNADYVLIKLDLEGRQLKGGKKKLKGTVYMQGVPYYDPADMTIKVKDLAYSVKSKNVLVKSAEWLLKAGFENQMKKYMVFPVKDRIDQARKMVESSINNGYKINDYATLKGNLNSIEPQGIYLTPQSLKALVNAKGKISIILDKL